MSNTFERQLELAALHTQLADALLQSGCIQNGKVVSLASGRTSTFYCDLKTFMLKHPKGWDAIGQLIVDRLSRHDTTFVGGEGLGGTMVTSALVRCNLPRIAPQTAFLIETPEGASTPVIVGLHPGALEKRHVTIVEDVTTSGKSALGAVDVVRRYNGHVTHVLSIADREEGAAEALSKRGIELESLFTRSEMQAMR